MADDDFLTRHAGRIVWDGDCALWQGGGHIYGQVYAIDLATGLKRKVYAHRASWEAANGEAIPEGQVVRHKCDNPRCVNPDHLEVGTYQDNTGDMIERGRASWQRPGWRSQVEAQSKLSETDVIDIRRRHRRNHRGRNGSTDLARRYGVHRRSISDAARGETWAHVRDNDND